MKKIFWILAVLILFTSCENDYSIIYTGEVSDIGYDRAVFNAKVVNIGRNGAREYGFVWNSSPGPNVNNSEKILIPETPRIGIICQEVTATIKKDVVYYVRSYIKDSDIIVYGNEVTFSGIPPVVNDIYPETGNLNDTIVILGENFSDVTTKNLGKFGPLRATVVRSAHDSIWAVVQNELSIASADVTVSISNYGTGYYSYVCHNDFSGYDPSR